MNLQRSVSDVLAEHVTFEVECIDRMYLNVFVPSLQSTRPGWSGTSTGSWAADRLDRAAGQDHQQLRRRGPPFLTVVGEENPRTLPVMSRRSDSRGETLLQAGDNETVARLDCPFTVVSTYFWSALEPTIRSDGRPRLDVLPAEARKSPGRRTSAKP